MAQPNKETAQMEMDLIMSETKDPVSGNTAPLGAKPEEVRDDVPINASPNEFMINAATRRYYGTEFFEELQKSAEEGWKRIRDGEESYFRDDELEVMDDEKGDTDKPINMQEGGAVPGEGITVPKPVGGGYGRYGGTGSPFMGFESKTFTSPETGQRIIIYYFNGRPMSRIPAGFREVSQDVVEEQQTVAAERGDDKEDISLESIGISDKTFRNKAVKDWTDEDYEGYSKSKPMGSLEKLFVGGIGFALGGPGVSLGLSKFAEQVEKKQAEAVQQSLASRMKSGNVNQQQLDIYSNAVKTASDRLYGGFKDSDGKLPDGLDLMFTSEKARDDYYEGLSSASDSGFKTGYDAFTNGFGIGKDRTDPLTGAVTKGTAFDDPDLTDAEQKAAMEKARSAGVSTNAAPSYATTDMGEAGRTSAPRDEKSSRLDVSNPNTSANVAEHLSDREKESLRAFPETAAHYVATANRRANEAAAGDSSNTDRAKEKSDSGGFSFSDFFS